jgi:hypothetical protein
MSGMGGIRKAPKKPQKKKYRIINSIGVWLRNLFKKAS